MRQLPDTGHAVVLVSHKLEEVFAVADTVTVLRDGHSVAEASRWPTTPVSQVVDLMVGRAHAAAELGARTVDRDAVPALALTGVSTGHGHRDLDLTVAKGEIVGLYGLVGAGRTELARALLGLDAITGGRSPCTAPRPGSAASARRCAAPHRLRDREPQGARACSWSSRSPATSASPCGGGWQGGLVADRAERDLVDRYTELLGIRLASPRQLAGQLSGGNQQKVSLAKWLAADCDILIVDEPTVGIDVRTKAAFHELMADLAAQGRAILLISSDLPEIVTLADRIAVMADRRIQGTLPNTRDYDEMSQPIIRLIHAPLPQEVR